jgi:hypothetical protein
MLSLLFLSLGAVADEPVTHPTKGTSVCVVDQQREAGTWCEQVDQIKDIRQAVVANADEGSRQNVPAEATGEVLSGQAQILYAVAVRPVPPESPSHAELRTEG